LATQAIRNLTLFSAQISRADAQRSELRRMIGRAFDGALTPLIQFLAEEEELTRDEIAELRKLIKRRAQS
jgi:predicted transcriptional regulator